MNMRGNVTGIRKQRGRRHEASGGAGGQVDVLEARVLLANSLPGSVADGGLWLWPNQLNSATATGSINVSTQLDQYAIAPTVAGTYTVVVNSPVLNSEFRVYGASGTPLTAAINNNFSTGVETTDVTLPANAWCYVLVAGYLSSVGSYTVTVSGPAITSSTISTPAPTYLGQASGSVGSPGQVSYYKLTAPVGVTALNVALSPQAGFDSYGGVFNASGVRLAELRNGNAGQVDWANAVAVTGGANYFIGVSAFNRPAVGSYVLNVDFDPDNYGDPPPTFAPPAVPTLMRFNPLAVAALSANITDVLDVNYHAFAPHDAGMVQIEVSGAVDGQLRVYDQSGAALTGVINSAAAGGTEQVTLDLAAGVLYYVGVGGAGTSTGSYTVTITAPPMERAEILTPPPAYVGDAAGALVYGGDFVCYQIVAPPATTSVALRADPADGLNTRMDVYDSGGRFIKTIANGGVGAADTGTSTATGGQLYYVIVSGQTSSDVGTYTFSADFSPDGIEVAVDGTVGADMISITKSGTNLSVRLNGVATTYPLSRVVSIVAHGGAGNDTIIVGAGLIGCTIWGDDGNDNITGGDGADLIHGGNGNDTLTGGDGNDTILGNFDDDSIVGGLGDDQLQGGLGLDTIYGGDGNDVLLGGDGQDLLWGEAGDDWIEGRGKADVIHGGAGNDTIYGGAGSDSITGDDGNDWVDVGVSVVFHDSVDGGAGTDSCLADGNDLLISIEIVLA